MSVCTHELHEMDTAAHWDGLCPLCLQAEIEQLRIDKALWESRTKQGAEIISGNTTKIERLLAELHTERYTREQHEWTIRELSAEVERLRAERNEWKAKWLALDEFARRELERRALGQKS